MRAFLGQGEGAADVRGRGGGGADADGGVPERGAGEDGGVPAGGAGYVRAAGGERDVEAALRGSYSASAAESATRRRARAISTARTSSAKSGMPLRKGPRLPVHMERDAPGHPAARPFSEGHPAHRAVWPEQPREEHQDSQRQRRRHQPDAAPVVAAAGQHVAHRTTRAGHPGADQVAHALRHEGDESLRGRTNRSLPPARRCRSARSRRRSRSRCRAAGCRRRSSTPRAGVAEGEEEVAQRPGEHADEQDALDPELREERTGAGA